MVAPVRRGGRAKGYSSDSDGFTDLLRNAATALGLKSVNRQIESVTESFMTGSFVSCNDISMKYERCMRECGDEDCQKYQKSLSLHCRHFYPTASDIEEADQLYDAYMTNNKTQCAIRKMMFDECVSYVGEDHEHCRSFREELSRYCQAFEKGGQPAGETVGWWRRIWD
ncbi:uncharacterized protein LOC132275400 [Cornus florida]|uniref:uncharacterized protein LOC132275400 n=1 Tax=Cornus florida TaxID=4283 RepID=UPI0028A019D4|nr:uncharacterized protein LOC132275400 [Cornus florida]